MLAATLITAALALAIFAAVFIGIIPHEERTLAMICFAAILPMSWLMFHNIRLPLDAWLTAQLGKKSELLWWLQMMYAPVTEEPAKLWPLLLPPVRRAITTGNVGRIALALGIGFAVGEIFTVGLLVMLHQPKVAALPWYELGGFIFERLETCLLHPGMTALALAGWRRGRGFWLGLGAAMLAHFLGNFPIGAMHRGWLGKNPALAQVLVTLWVFALAWLALAWLAWLITGKRNLSQLLYGRADCPECGREYTRGMFTGLNAGGSRRYERCPHCRHWHWTNAKPRAEWVVAG